jgi:hypothetical protein
MTADGSDVFRVAETVLKVSPPAFPNVISDMTAKAQQARIALGPHLGDVIPVPLGEWQMNGVTCALFERLTPIHDHGFRDFFQRRTIALQVLRWLRKVTEIDRGVPTGLEECLRALEHCPSERVKEAGRIALSQTAGRSFQPRSGVMHGDLWLGNVMLDPSGARDFMIIDWGGSQANGFPIFDLIRFAESTGLGARALRRELEAHALSLKCHVEDTRIYLAGALGHICLHLEQFPMERFIAMAERNLRTLEGALCLSSMTENANLRVSASSSARRSPTPVGLAA